MSTIKQRLSFLNKTLKTNLIEICKSNNIVYKDNNDKRIKKKYIIDNILKNEFSENELQIFNEPCENLVDKNNREKILKLYKNNELKNILQNYNLSTNGIKKYLIDRILNYEYNNKIVTLKEQKSQEFYLEVSNIEITDNTFSKFENNLEKNSKFL